MQIEIPKRRVELLGSVLYSTAAADLVVEYRASRCVVREVRVLTSLKAVTITPPHRAREIWFRFLLACLSANVVKSGQNTLCKQEAPVCVREK